MWTRTAAALVLVLMAMAPAAAVAAQFPPAGDWSVVGGQPVGTPVVVESITAEELSGAIEAVRDVDLAIVLPSGERRWFPKTLVKEVRTPGRVRDGLSNGMVNGALVGAAALGAVVLAAFARCDEGCEGPALGTILFPAIAVGAAGGLGVGAAVDAARTRPLVLYRR